MASLPSVAVVVPTYGHFDFARKTLLSLARTCDHEDTLVIVADDGSPDWNADWYKDIHLKIFLARSPANQGLTATWNHGFDLARVLHAQIVVLGNSDVIFAPNWQSMFGALDKGYQFVGPVTNAPGTSCALGVQDVRSYLSDYIASDTPEAIEETGALLKMAYAGHVAPCNINGFCMVGKTADWTNFAYDAIHLFPPEIPIMPSGRKNPTPKMTGQEDVLAACCRQRGWRMGVALDSFVFHYRSVTRGPRHTHGQAYRPSL